MNPDGKRPSVEREQTDESLRTERRQSDGALVELQAAVEEDADEVVRCARELADAVVVEAREKADLATATHPRPTDVRCGGAGRRSAADLPSPQHGPRGTLAASSTIYPFEDGH